MSEVQNGSISLRDAPQLAKAYEQACVEKKEWFTFKGMELYTGYAKYLLEYMAMVQKTGMDSLV